MEEISSSFKKAPTLSSEIRHLIRKKGFPRIDVRNSVFMILCLDVLRVCVIFVPRVTYEADKKEQ
jgi:hypothetical protein